MSARDRLAQPPSSVFPAEASRLLGLLQEPGAYATETEAGDRLLVAGPRKGISVRIGSASLAAGNHLAQTGLAAWETGDHSGRRRLVVSETGRARAAREAAPEGVTAFRAQHGAVEPGRIREGAPAVERAESPLAWLATRRGADGRPLVDPASFEAGERLRRDITLAQMVPRVTANWSAAPRSDPAGTQLAYSDAVIAARQRVDRALAAAGPDFSGLLIDVCGFLKGLSLIEAERGWPARSGKIVLGLALAALARHYGLQSEARGPDRRRIRHWGAADYRPEIAPG